MLPIQDDKISEIRSLRARGYSVPEISRMCEISKSTASRYIKNINILPKHYQRWLNRRNASKIISERHWDTAKGKAEQLMDCLTRKDLALIATSLYWAEGSKKDFGLSNTDPDLIRLFLYTLRTTFGIQNSDLKISVRIYEDLNKKNCLKFWSEVTGIKLGKETSVNVLKGKKKGKLKYGMCRVRVKKGGLLLKEIFCIIKRLNQLIMSS